MRRNRTLERIFHPTILSQLAAGMGRGIVLGVLMVAGLFGLAWWGA